MNIIQTFDPTEQSTEEEIEQFHGDLYRALLQTKKREINLILGDWNANVGKGGEDD